MKFFIVISILLCSLTSFAQHDWDSKDWNKESLGFGCSVDAQMTKPVTKMTQLFMEKQFDEIRKALNSELPADQFLAVFVMEKLLNKKELEISELELQRIQEIKVSNQKVPVCSGCTYWSELQLKELFESGKGEVMSISAGYWFDNYYKVYYKKKKKK